MKKPVTLQDVAAAANVSHMTVHRALIGSSLVRQVTAERIRRIADELGYRPNLAARAMRQGLPSRVTLLCSSTPGRSHLTLPMLHGLHEILRQHAMALSIVRLPDTDILDPERLKQAMSGGEDATIVCYQSRIPQDLRAVIAGMGVPAVWMNIKADADAVRFDDFGTGRQAARLLLDAGHRSILYHCHSYQPNDPDEHYSADERFFGVAQACADAGAQLHVARRKVDGEARMEFARQALAMGRTTGAVCYGPAAAWMLAQALRAEGRRIPEDYSLVSCDGDWGPFQERPLTAFTSDRLALGRCIGEMLLAKFLRTDSGQPCILIGSQLVAGGATTAPPPAS